MQAVVSHHHQQAVHTEPAAHFELCIIVTSIMIPGQIQILATGQQMSISDKIHIILSYGQCQMIDQITTVGQCKFHEQHVQTQQHVHLNAD